MVINYIYESIAQKLDDNGIHFLYARKLCTQRKVAARLRLNVLCWCRLHQKRVNTVGLQEAQS